MRLSKKTKSSKITAVCDALKNGFDTVEFGAWCDSRAWDVNGCDSNFINPNTAGYITARGASVWVLDILQEVGSIDVYFGGLKALGKKIKSKSDYNKMCYLLNWLNADTDSFKNDMAAVVVHRGKYDEITDIALFHN